MEVLSCLLAVPITLHQIATCREKKALLHHYFNNHYSLSKGTKLCSGCITQDTASSDHLSIMASSYWPMGGRFRQVSLYFLSFSIIYLLFLLIKFFNIDQLDINGLMDYLTD